MSGEEEVESIKNILEAQNSPLAIAILEERNDAARILIEADLSQTEGYGMYGSALHLAVA